MRERRGVGRSKRAGRGGDNRSTYYHHRQTNVPHALLVFLNVVFETHARRLIVKGCTMCVMYIAHVGSRRMIARPPSHNVTGVWVIADTQ